jgi:hypothetical protein
LKKSEIINMPQFFDRYILMAEDLELVTLLEKYKQGTEMVEKRVLKALGDKRYAPDKWTVKDILQHIIDNERIQAYRAMRIARNDDTVLPGYDEQVLAQWANASKRPVDKLLEEFRLTRASSIAMFRSFDKEMLMRESTCFKVKISPLALGFVIVGHQIHHFNIIKEKYF